MASATLRIFISSPGDVGQERVIAGRVIERLAGEFGDSVTLDAVLWEHEPMRATSHFQEQIIRPSETDIVVCILWSRLGSRLPEGFRRADGSTFASGTEWEFEDAAAAYRARGAPDLLVYRKTLEAFASLSDRESYLRRLEQKEALDDLSSAGSARPRAPSKRRSTSSRPPMPSKVSWNSISGS